jgi:hypothetical protein
MTSGVELLSPPEADPARGAEIVRVRNPAAGEGLALPVPGAVLWRPLSVVFTLQTSADVADRYATVEYQDASGEAFAVSAAAVLVTASSTQRFAGHRRFGWGDWNTGTDVMFPLLDAWLEAGTVVAIVVAAIDNTDQLSDIRFLMEQRPVRAEPFVRD